MDCLKDFQYADEIVPSIFTSCNLIAEKIISDSLINPSLSRHENLIAIWTQIRAELSILEQELSQFCEREWNNLSLYQEGHICSHSLSAMCSMMTLPYFSDLDYHDQNILLLGLLFHDIAKRGRPSYKGKDPIHPFRSAATTLGIFNRLGWIKNEEQIDETIRFINSAFIIYKEKEFMDNSKLEEIFIRLLYATGIFNSLDQKYESYSKATFGVPREKSYVLEILIIILLHQSVDLDPKYPNFTPIPTHSLSKFFSRRLLKLLSILHMGDNGSYNLPIPYKTWSFPKRIWKSFKSLQKILKSA